MELKHSYQIGFKELKTENIDCIIAASGFHSRCTFVSENINLKHTRKLLITFDENNYITFRKENESVFNKLGFHSIRAKVNSGKEVEILLEKLCKNNISECINILIDYSCMPKLWLATILNFISNNELPAQRINIFFAFTPKRFIPGVRKKVEYAGPITETRGFIQNNENITLIAGLDNSPESVIKLKNDINPEKIYAFIPDPAFVEAYSKSVMEKNKPLLDQIDKENIIKYPANNPEVINSKLTSLCLELRLNSRIIIVPLGPKTFALTSLLLSIRFPDIKIWDVTSKVVNYNPEEGNVSGEPIILKVIFCNDDEDEYH